MWGWGDCTCARASAFSLPSKPLIPVPEVTRKEAVYPLRWLVRTKHDVLLLVHSASIIASNIIPLCSSNFAPSFGRFSRCLPHPAAYFYTTCLNCSLCLRHRVVFSTTHFCNLFIRTTTSSIHTEAILAEVTMSMAKNTMVRGKKGKGG